MLASRSEAASRGQARGNPPRLAYIAALLASMAGFAAVMYLLLEVQWARSFPILLPTTLCLLGGVGFAYAWPAGSWRWGLWVSSAFWLAFGFVFVSYLVNHRFEAQPAVSAVLAATAACLGAIAGQWLARRTKTLPGDIKNAPPN